MKLRLTKWRVFLVFLKMGYFPLQNLSVLIMVRKKTEKTHMRILGYKHIFKGSKTQKANKEILQKC